MAEKNNITYKNNQSFGFVEVHRRYEKIKEALLRVSNIEYALQSPSTLLSLEEDIQDFEEMEIHINTRRESLKKGISSISILKWTLIIFESFGSFLMLGIISHGFNLKDTFGDYYFIWNIIEVLGAVLFSFAIINFAMNCTIKKKEDDKIQWNKLSMALLAVFGLPFFNLLMIYGINLEIENKTIYLISSFFTSFFGILLLMRNSDVTQDKSEYLKKLETYRDLLQERKQKIALCRKYHLEIVKLNNQYDDILDEENLKENTHPLYKSLTQFLTHSVDFDEWMTGYIEEQKQKNKSKKHPFPSL
ncbi:hypothetical protein [Chryseobacterium limigenitum]|uniref:Uncharacterized protein n=1 Tax=Chryseobacterium limigenitum TaxID=1612149 RepID=A0A1K2ISL9_9FLAO|nr:hypothetical protein [Chryseobacterium limigenitum]SFZ95250.1 hypothetical protein SAMN05216324_10919 [Chryseobacterium limigenitum]